MKGVKDVQAPIEDLEHQVTLIEDEYGEKLNDKLKVAIFISKVPEALKEKLFEIEKGSAETKYDAAKEVVVTMVSRRADQRRPKEDEIMVMGWTG